MCNCDEFHTCSRCLSLPWDAALAQPFHVLTDDEYDRLIDEHNRELTTGSDLLERT